MSKLQTPFYDPTKTYEENYDQGPSGAFADGKVFEQKSEPQHEYLGHKVHLPFGIPAGPILNSSYVKAAFEKGFDIVVYKTVRSDFYPVHPFPNVLSVNIDGDLTLEKLKQPLVADTNYHTPLSITNSFNVPSRKSEIWQEDAKKAMEYAGKGQIMVLSFMGTVKENQTSQEFIDDFILAGKLANETGAKIIEADLSCPNNGDEGLVCYDIETTRKISAGVRKAIGNTPYVMKVGYYEDDKQMEKLAEIGNEYADEIIGINTLPGIIVDKDGNQALPGGPKRKKGGVCGASIKWAGLDFVRRLKKIKEKHNYKFSIGGTGGVTIPQDYFEYKDAGADSVFSATGAMWNPFLAQEIKRMVK